MNDAGDLGDIVEMFENHKLRKAADKGRQYGHNDVLQHDSTLTVKVS